MASFLCGERKPVKNLIFELCELFMSSSIFYAASEADDSVLSLLGDRGPMQMALCLVRQPMIPPPPAQGRVGRGFGVSASERCWEME